MQSLFKLFTAKCELILRVFINGAFETDTQLKQQPRFTVTHTFYLMSSVEPKKKNQEKNHDTRANTIRTIYFVSFCCYYFYFFFSRRVVTVARLERSQSNEVAVHNALVRIQCENE